ncbi:DUF2818 family protein [uncultured Massilia sp.]|uniref:DUF2818 family protein n=1 Tax=uncultured Massilia sp. TaxID=169973 RepID=UPI0025CFB820|nr:DUF2818 family protein [uncultured Massilia sp.]
MDASLASWLVIAVAIAFANLPFVNERVFGFIAMKPALGKAHAKYFAVRLLELFVLYFVVGALARLLESRIGNVFTQTWEFYAITGCLFVVLAFPGFVARYLRKRRP